MNTRDIMNKNTIVWKEGIPCINLDEQPVYLRNAGTQHARGPDEVPRFGPQRPPIRGIWPTPDFDEMWEFKIEFLQPDFTSLQKQKDQNFFEALLKELEELFKS